MFNCVIIGIININSKPWKKTMTQSNQQKQINYLFKYKITGWSSACLKHAIAYYRISYRNKSTISQLANL